MISFKIYEDEYEFVDGPCFCRTTQGLFNIRIIQNLILDCLFFKCIMYGTFHALITVYGDGQDWITISVIYVTLNLQLW